MGEKTEHIAYLEKVYIKLMAAKQAYQNYLDEEKTFLHASALKKINDKLLALLNSPVKELSPELTESIKLLKEHLIVWSEKWEAHRAVHQPEWNDTFVFQNSHTFPAKAERKIIDTYHSLVNSN